MMYCQVVLKGSKIENIEKIESRMLEEVSLFLSLYFILLVLSVWSVSYITYAKVAVPLWESIEDIENIYGLNCRAQEREIPEYSHLKH